EGTTRFIISAETSSSEKCFASKVVAIASPDSPTSSSIESHRQWHVLRSESATPSDFPVCGSMVHHLVASSLSGSCHTHSINPPMQNTSSHSANYVVEAFII